MDDWFPTYEALWRRAEAEDVWVRYDGNARHGLAGYFDARLDERRSSMIAITRPYYIEPMDEPRREGNAPPPLPQPDILYELITLAHEYGHFRSFLDRTPRDEWLIYDGIAHRRSTVESEVRRDVPDGMSDGEASDWFRRTLGERFGKDACARIMREEELAWRIGREVLAEFGFTAWTALDERERLGLHNHRYRLGLDDAWPEDELPACPTE